jgi:enamine deaminase RidA (YjgF/YER057c/UK114 family)
VAPLITGDLLVLLLGQGPAASITVRAPSPTTSPTRRETAAGSPGAGVETVGRNLSHSRMTKAVVSLIGVSVLLSGIAVSGESRSRVRHLNPEAMFKNPAFSQGVVVPPGHTTIYVGEQNAVDGAGKVVGKGDLAAQTTQVFKNLKTVLNAGGATLQDVVSWRLYVVQGQPLQEGFKVFQKEWGTAPNPPTISFQFVSGLANPDYLVGMDAIAIRPQ